MRTIYSYLFFILICVQNYNIYLKLTNISIEISYFSFQFTLIPVLMDYFDKHYASFPRYLLH